VSTQFAIFQRSGAQQVSTGVASISATLTSRLQAARDRSVFAGAGRDLVAIIALATQIVQKVGNASAQEKSAATKVISALLAILLVIIAIVVAAVTFGTGAAVALAVVAAVAAIVSAAVTIVSALPVLMTATVISPMLVTMINAGAALLTSVQTAVQGFLPVQAVDPAAARSRLFQAILQALRQIDGLTPQMDTLTGQCLGDPPAVYVALQDASNAVQQILLALRSTQSDSDGQAVASALDGLAGATRKAVQVLRPLR